MWSFYPEIKTVLDEGAYLPKRAHPTDAGADIRTPVDVDVPAHGSAIVHTGVHVETPHHCAAMVKSKSGLNIKSGIKAEGVIDEGYDGEIVVRLDNLNDEPHHFDRGDKITQLVVVFVAYPIYVQADSIGGGERGSAGFGSTGR